MHLENWIYWVLCGNARTGKISKQQVQFALAETVPQGWRNRDSEMGQRSVDVPMSGARFLDCV